MWSMRVVSRKISPHVYQLINRDVSFHLFYLLSLDDFEVHRCAPSGWRRCMLPFAQGLWGGRTTTLRRPPLHRR